MFIEKPKVHRSGLPYLLWKLTYRNWIWKKGVPTRKSICPFTWRTVIIGIITLACHLVYAPLRIVFYEILYRFARVLFKNDFLATAAVWLVTLLLIYLVGLEMFFPWIIGFAVTMFAAGGVCFGIGSLIGWFFMKTAPGKSFTRFIIQPTVGGIIRGSVVVFYRIPRFVVIVYQRYYAPKYKLPSDRYEFNSGRSQAVILLLFWLALLGLPFLGLLGGAIGLVPQLIPFLPVLPSGLAGLLTILAVELILVAITTVYSYFELKKMDREIFYTRFPQYRPAPKPSFVKEHITQPLKAKAKSVWETHFQIFVDWGKAKWSKMCPEIEFVD
ncbi:MAG: hypothetical protein WCV50_03980 [Patescibacteria group bacterium]|jgi:hypothetical protein